MNTLKNLQLEKKLTLGIMLLVVLALVLSSGLLVSREISDYRKKLAQRLDVLAQVVAANAAAPLVFQSAGDASITLDSLKADAYITSAILYDVNQQVFASFVRENQPSFNERFEVGGAFESNHYSLFKEVLHDDELIGYIRISSSLAGLRLLLFNLVAITLFIGLFCAALAYFFARFIVAIVSSPIRMLAETARHVEEHNDYSRRAEKISNDELGELTDQFNSMLAKVGKQDAQLRDANQRVSKGFSELQQEKEALKQAHRREQDLSEKLLRSKRLESLGLLAGGVAHDLNNTLGPLVGYPDIILGELEDGHPVREDVERMGESARKAAEVIQDLLTMGRRENVMTGSVDLNKLVAHYLNSPAFLDLEKRYRNITVETHLGSNTELCFDGSEPHMVQVLNNLVRNACEAIGTDGCKIVIDTRRVTLETIHEGYETILPGTFCRLQVRDNGPGIVADQLQHLFEPFYTNKELGESGSGLGLAVVYGVVKDHEGYIDLQSVVGQGTIFSFYFRAAASPIDLRADTPWELHGSERILVVDDVEEQRGLAQRLLARNGYDVSTVASGEDCIKTLATEDFDLIILDMIMPNGMDGVQTYEAIQRVKPGQTCIVASGYIDSSRIHSAQQVGLTIFVSKPYTIDTICKGVRTALAGQPESSQI